MFPGCVIGVSLKGTKKVLPFGRFTYDQDSPKVGADTLYDLASITKSIPTASLALILIEEGVLSLDDRVTRYIPELCNDHGATIGDLLQYRVHGKRMSALIGRSADEIKAYVLKTGFDGPPGERAYSNLPSYVLGLILEEVLNKPLLDLAQQYIFDPLKMTSTTYFPESADCAPTEIQNGETIQGVVHDESARVFALEHRAVGHAGLFSTVTDLLTFLEALFPKGIFGNKFPKMPFGNYLQAVRNGAEKGLGWELGDGRFGKTGFTGTNIVIDPKKEAALVILSNRTYPTRPQSATAINTFRKDIADIVFG